MDDPQTFSALADYASRRANQLAETLPEYIDGLTLVVGALGKDLEAAKAAAASRENDHG